MNFNINTKYNLNDYVLIISNRGTGSKNHYLIRLAQIKEINTCVDIQSQNISYHCVDVNDGTCDDFSENMDGKLLWHMNSYYQAMQQLNEFNFNGEIND